MTNKCYGGCEFSQEYDDGLGRLCLHPDSPYYCECERIRRDLPEPDYCPLKRVPCAKCGECIHCGETTKRGYDGFCLKNGYYCHTSDQACESSAQRGDRDV